MKRIVTMLAALCVIWSCLLPAISVYAQDGQAYVLTVQELCYIGEDSASLPPDNPASVTLTPWQSTELKFSVTWGGTGTHVLQTCALTFTPQAEGVWRCDSMVEYIGQMAGKSLYDNLIFTHSATLHLDSGLLGGSAAVPVACGSGAINEVAGFHEGEWEVSFTVSDGGYVSEEEEPPNEEAPEEEILVVVEYDEDFLDWLLEQLADESAHHAGPAGTTAVIAVAILSAILGAGGGLGGLAGAAGAGAAGGGLGGLAGDLPPTTPPPESMLVTDPATGAQRQFNKNPQTGEWESDDGRSVLDVDSLPDWQKQRVNDRGWADEQAEKLAAGDNAQDQAIRYSRDAEAQAMKNTEAQIKENAFLYKHGASSMDEALKKITAQMDTDAQKAADAIAWGNNMDTAFKVASITEFVSDGLIDGLAKVTGPGGKAIQAAYKITKGAAGNMSGAYADGKGAGDILIAGGRGGGKGVIVAISDQFGTGTAKEQMKKYGIKLGGELFYNLSDSSQGYGEAFGKSIVNVGIDAAGDNISKAIFGSGTTDFKKVVIKTGTKMGRDGTKKLAKNLFK